MNIKFTPSSISIALLSLLLANCVPTPASVTALRAPTELPLNEVYELLPTRKAVFEGALSISVDVTGIEVSKRSDEIMDPHRIRLTVRFTNTLTSTLVMRKPQNMGFQGPTGSEAIHDLEFVLGRDDVGRVSTPLQGYDVPDYSKVTVDDFIRLGPGETYSLPAEMELPLVFFKDTGFHGKMPPGTYTLYVIYENYLLGYRVSPAETPPAELQDVQEEDEWFRTHTMEVDLNSWVGRTWSEKIEFIVPE